MAKGSDDVRAATRRGRSPLRAGARAPGWRAVLLALCVPACATLRGGDRVDAIEGGEVLCPASESSDAGRLHIAVVDGLGGPVSQAAVTVRRLSAEAVFSIVADDSGHLRIEHLLPGSYRVEVALEGEPRGSREAVPVRAGCTTRVTVPVTRRR